MAKIATVFGGTGFIGRAIVWRLAQAGWIVRVPTRSLSKAATLLPYGAVGQIVPLPWRLGFPQQTLALVKGADLVVNLLGILAERGASTFEAVQVDAAAEIAAASVDEGVRHLVHLSAIGADAASPSVYARTKAAGEAAVLKHFPRAVILRPSIVFGPEDDFFNRFAAMTTLSPFLPLIGGGKTRFQPVFVGDVAEAVVTTLSRPNTAGQVYELGGPEVLTFKALLQKMLAEMGRCRLLLPLPWGLAKLMALAIAWLPKPPLTRDQIKLLARDNVVAETAHTLKDLGVVPTPLSAILPNYLGRYRRQGV